MTSSENNGGKTSYYDIPGLSLKEVTALIRKVQDGESTVAQCAETIHAAFPQTLNDLIEHKRMAPWQHEVFKACYALDERAQKNGGSREREINKMLYYTERGKNLEKARQAKVQENMNLIDNGMSGISSINPEGSNPVTLYGFEPRDISITSMISSTGGPGVRITHIPSGLFAESVQERSQHKNREIAMIELRKKVLNLEPGHLGASPK